jgi:hypothetical protein
MYFFIIFIFFTSVSFARYEGSGDLNLSKDTANAFANYITNNIIDRYTKTRQQSSPGLFYVTNDGLHSHIVYCKYNETGCPRAQDEYRFKAICSEDAKRECFIFAEKNIIVWDKKKIEILSENKNEVTQILVRENFYKMSGNQIMTPKKSDKTDANNEKKPKESINNIVDQLQNLNNLYKSGALTKDEFEKAKAKLLK